MLIRMRSCRIIFAVICVAVMLIVGCKRNETNPPPSTKPAPATTPAATAPVASTYIDVVRALYPRVGATQPLGVPLELNDAAHLVLKEPVYLCPRGDLWLTRADAALAEEILKSAGDDETHVLRDHVRFAHWSVDSKGKWVVRLVVGDGAQFQWIDAAGRHKLSSAKNYRWERAQTWNQNQIVVPTDRGVSVFDVESEPLEHDQQLIAAPSGNEPQAQFDAQGLLAWVPWENDKPGSDGAWRFVDGKWSHLADKNWPKKIMHLVPLLDGSVLQLIAGDDGTVQIALATLGAGQVDEQQVKTLVEQLANPDPKKRAAAFAELARYGNASWPVLEKLMDNQPPEARLRIRQLLENRIQPTLGGMTLVDGKAKIVDRFSDGGILLYAPAGVNVPREQPTPLVVTPALVSIRPGRTMELLDEIIVESTEPEKQKIYAYSDEWVVSDPVEGPRRLEGNHLQPLLKPKESTFCYLVGKDRRGRWLFRKSANSTETLILDPTIPDPTPRLPVWLLNVANGQVGWEKNDWPVIKRPGAWYLNETAWQALDESKDPIITTPPPPPRAPIATSAPATTPSTQPSTQASTMPSAPLILIDAQARKYFDCAATLTVIDKFGRQVVWPLPMTAIGKGDVRLVATKDGTLFLWNAPGRILRIKPTPAATQPFQLEATFTHRIPDIDHPTRMWLDPAGRLIMTYDTHLAIMFPEGHIPPALARLISAAELEDQEP